MKGSQGFLLKSSGTIFFGILSWAVMHGEWPSTCIHPIIDIAAVLVWWFSFVNFGPQKFRSPMKRWVIYWRAARGWVILKKGFCILGLSPFSTQKQVWFRLEPSALWCQMMSGGLNPFKPSANAPLSGVCLVSLCSYGPGPKECEILALSPRRLLFGLLPFSRSKGMIWPFIPSSWAPSDFWHQNRALNGTLPSECKISLHLWYGWTTLS